MKTPSIFPGITYHSRRPEPIIIAQGPNGPRMLTLKEVRQRMSTEDPKNKSPKFLAWLKETAKTMLSYFKN